MRGGRLREVPFIVIRLENVWYFEIVVANGRWSLTRDFCKGRFDFFYFSYTAKHIVKVVQV